MGTNQSKTNPDPSQNLSQSLPGSFQSHLNPNLSPSNQTHQDSTDPFQRSKDDFFIFLKNEEKSSKSSSFFSKNGLSQDIIQMTGAEPNIPLEAFYALYNTLWPQIRNQPSVSFKDVWTRFIGGSLMKGSLCPPEKLITERRTRFIKRVFSKPKGEDRFFHDLDLVVSSIFDLKQKIIDYPSQLTDREDIVASLDLLQGFYLRFRNQVKGLVQAILEKEQINASYVSESDALEDLLEPKAVMMSDIFPHHWAYCISRKQAQNLLSMDAFSRSIRGNFSFTANHRVIALPENTAEPLIFFKANGNPPIQPEKEFMVYSLYRNLQIPIPETALLILTDVFDANPDCFYAVQASEAVIGKSPLEAYRNPETVFDHEAYVSQVIGAFITNPSDGSFKNFKYSPKYKTFVSIDNDLVFKPELARENVVNVKSMLYLLPQMDQAIPDSIKTFFMTLDPRLTILSWLQDLSQKNREYQLLFTRLAFQYTCCLHQNLLPQGETPSLATCLEQEINVDAELHLDEAFYPRITISTNLLRDLTEKLKKIENLLSYSHPVNLQTLFEEVSPNLGKYYGKLRLEFNDVEEALEALWGLKKNGVDYSYVSSLLRSGEFASSVMNHQNSQESIPGDFVQEYKNLLISGGSPLDNYIRRHNHRRRNNILNLQEASKELRLLIQESLIDSQSIRDIVDFCHSISKMKVSNDDQNHIKDLISLFSHLPHAELKWLFRLEKYFMREDCEMHKDLLSSSLEVNGAFMGQRTFILTESERNYLFDRQGNIKKNISLTGRSSVTFFPEKDPQFYLKQYPEFPGYEFASILFMRLFGIQHLPYHDLLIIDSKYPALLTERIYGQPLLLAWRDPQAFSNLDPFHTGLLIISAMLLNPEDGKEDNFILSPDGKYLIPIDNDHCFLPSTYQKEGKFWDVTFTVNTALQTKTILFCLDEMYRPIPHQVKEHILSIDFDLLFTRWMTELIKIEEKCNNLMNQDQQTRFLENGTFMGIKFYTKFIENIYWKAHNIQDMLRKLSQLTPFDLLKAVEPFAANCYLKSFKQQERNQLNRFKAVTNQLYAKTLIDGSRVSVLDTRRMFEIINISEKDLQKDAIFQRMGPLDVLERLNQLVKERRLRIKTEQEVSYRLDVGDQEGKWRGLFRNLPGEAALKAFFANPKEGLVLEKSKLITSSRLTTLFRQAPNSGEKIKFLSLPNSPSLSSQEIRIIAKECPNIEYLDVSGAPNLKEIITQKGEWPLLTRLEAKECFALEKFVSYSSIRILRIGSYQRIDIFVEKSSLDILTISTKANKLELAFKKGKQFKIKFQDESFSNDNLLLASISKKEEVASQFSDWKITIGTKEFVFTTPWSKVFQEIFQLNSHLNSIYSAGEEAPSSDMFWIYASRLDASESEILPELNSPWTSFPQLDRSQSQIGDEGVKVLAVNQSLPNLAESDANFNNINEEGVDPSISNIFVNNMQCLNSSRNKDDKGGKQAFEENRAIDPEFDFNKSDIEKMRKIESAKNISQINNSSLCEDQIPGEPVERDKPQLVSFLHTESNREGSNESIKKNSSIVQEESFSDFKYLVNFLNTQ